MWDDMKINYLDITLFGSKEEWKVVTDLYSKGHIGKYS